jgi:SAM-dependent methyltransferase
MVDELHIVTLAYEGKAYPKRGISYTFADLRDLPYRDEMFDTVVSISTLEHVGMDNTAYAGDQRAAAASEDPVVETSAAVRELARVTRRGGRLLVTVPYGEPENHGWQRQFDRADVERLLEAADAGASDIAVYRFSPQGWSASSLESAADARYRVPVGAEAVACIAMTR